MRLFLSLFLVLACFAASARADDAQLAAVTAELDGVQAKLDAMAPGDVAAANEATKALNGAIGKLNKLRSKVKPDQYNPVVVRANELAKKIQARAKEPAAPKPPEPPQPPPGGDGGGTPPAGGAGTEPKPPAKPGELDWTGAPDVSSLSKDVQQAFANWKAQYAGLWKRLADEDGVALAGDAAGKKRAYDEALTKIRAPFRNPGRLNSTCLPFVTKKDADFSAFFEARLAEGKVALAAEQAKTDEALTKAIVDTDALDAEVKALKLGDAAAADALLAKKKAALDLLETTAAKVNPAYDKTKARLAAMEARINFRKSGQADDPSLAIDLSDAPIDALNPKQLERFSGWKTKFAAKLKEMTGQSDEYLVDKGHQQVYENDLGRIRDASIGALPKGSPLDSWVAKTEAQYRAIIQQKAAAGVAKLDGKKLDDLEAKLAAAQVKLEGLPPADVPAAERDLRAVADETEHGLGTLKDKATERAKGLGEVVGLFRKALDEKVAAGKTALAGAAADRDARLKEAMAIWEPIAQRYDFARFEAPDFPAETKGEDYPLREYTEEKNLAWAKSLKALQADVDASVEKVQRAAVLLKDADPAKAFVRSPMQLSFTMRVGEYIEWLKTAPKEKIAGVIEQHRKELARFVALGNGTDDPAKLDDQYLRMASWIASQVLFMREGAVCARSLAVLAKEIGGDDPAPHLAAAAALDAKIAAYQKREAASLATVVLEKEIEHPKVAEWRKLAEEAMKFSRSAKKNPDKDVVYRYVVCERLTTHESVEWSNLGRRIPVKYDTFAIRCIVKKDNGEHWIATKWITYYYQGWETYELQQWHVDKSSHNHPIPKGSIDK